MVKLEENKILSKNSPIEKLPLPRKVYIPLVQHIGKKSSPLVKVGEEVSLGQKIASSAGPVSSCLHASVSGKVIAIENWPHPTQGTSQAIVIENDGKDRSFFTGTRSPEEIERLSADEIRRIVHEAGIVGMGGAGFPTHIKLTPPKRLDSFILNAAECEPYLTGDYRLMIERTQDIIKGVQLILRCVGAKKVYIAIEDNKFEAIKAFEEEIRTLASKMPLVEWQVRVLKSQYPQGGEKQLIKNILNREVPSGRLPFDVGVLVNNVATCLAVYEAVYKNKPLYERVVTVSGDCLKNPKNLLVRIGTPVKDLIQFCKPLTKEPGKLVIGGPMMGIAQYTDEVTIIKTTTAVLLLSSQATNVFKENSCIRCGECVRNCPVGLMPCLISLAVERRNWKLAASYSPLDCIECGLCAYLCPAQRNLVQSIKYAKLKAK